jgi:hypothetical protein
MTGILNRVDVPRVDEFMVVSRVLKSVKVRVRL